MAIVGVGLIGGSIGLALRARGLADRVIGIGRDPQRLAEALRLGAIDRAETDPARGVAAADVAVVCTPVGRIAADVRELARDGPDALLITDAGSTKRTIVQDVESDPRAARMFVAAHPIAGSERKGVAAASADLFEGRACALTPTPRTPPDRLERASAFWRSLGCRLVTMDPDSHDRSLARTSHLPHAVASALAASIPAEDLDLAAGAYRDGTRVAASDASLWADIFLDNREFVLDSLDRFASEIDRFRAALERRDRSALLALWDEGRSNRDRFRDGSSAP